MNTGFEWKSYICKEAGQVSGVKKIAVMTSGGDAPGMNAAIRAVVRACAYYRVECKGVRLGYEGLIAGKLVPMGPRMVKNLIGRGGTILKTARSESFKTVAGRREAYEQLVQHGIDALIVIGGDGSFTGGVIFEKEYGIRVIGIPGTIDNDIYGTDQTIGYDTALNTVVAAIDKIRDTATSHNRLFFVEVMGRDAGFIAMNSGIGIGAQAILIPEENMALEALFSRLSRSHKSRKSSSIVVVAEGDQLGSAFDLAKAVKMRYPKYDIRVTVLGHIQRGGAPSCYDRVLASRLGVAAVEALLAGKTGLMVGIRHNAVVETPLDQAIKAHNPLDVELKKIADITAV